MLIERRTKTSLIISVSSSDDIQSEFLFLVEDPGGETVFKCKISLPAWDVGAGKPNQYIEVPINSESICNGVVRSTLKAYVCFNENKRSLPVFSLLKAAAVIEELDIKNIGSIIKLVDPKHMEAIRRGVEYATRTFLPASFKKGTACVITYANDSSGWFSAFYNHYSHHLKGSQNIYVISPKPNLHSCAGSLRGPPFGA